MALKLNCIGELKNCDPLNPDQNNLVIVMLQALVRFHEGEAQAALDKTKAAGGGKVVINDAELETRVLDGQLTVFVSFGELVTVFNRKCVARANLFVFTV